MVGFSFGLTSGVITTLGLIVGLDAGTNSRLAVIGGIITIAIADAFSDAFGIHMSQESENEHSDKEILESTLSTFFSKLVFALTFLIPILLLKLQTGVIISVAWGFLLLTILNYNLAIREKLNPFKTIMNHLSIAVIVVIATYLVGKWIAMVFI